MHRRTTAIIPLITAAALVTGVSPASAAPVTRQVTVICDGIGEVTLDVSASGTATVSGGDGQVSVTPSGSACHVRPTPGTVTSASSLPTVHVTANTDAVIADAAPRLVHAAASTNDPAAYGPVVAFPYQAQLAAWLNGRSGTSAIAYRGSGTQTIYSYVHGAATNVTASIVKGQVLATVMVQAQQAGRGLTAWEKSQIVPMIRNSDNDATTALWDHIGRGPAVAKVMASMGLRDTVPGSGGFWGLTVTSAPDQVVLMDHFGRSNPVLSDANRAYALSLMRTVASDQDWGVTAGPGTDIAKKNGWLPRSDGWHVNSIGYNHKAPRAYSIAVLTHSTTASMDTQIATIEGASRIVWSHQSAVSVRGDWTGDGHPDVLGIKGDGLYLFRAGANGRLGAPSLMANGWGGITWIGSPGDMTGDGITDLLARNSAGALLLYRGTGNGGVEFVRQVGQNWNGITSFATVGDFDGDHVPDLLGRAANGDLLRYRLPASGGATLVGRVGTSWRPMVAILGAHGINNDALGDVLAVRSDGKAFAFTSTGSRLSAAVEVGHGWRPSLVAVPGDLTGDGIDDIAYQTGSGLMTYPIARGGRIGPAQANTGSAAGFRLLG